MKEIEHERRDWMIVFVILLFGLLCVILAGGWALRFSSSWHLDTNMGSELDPNSDYLTRPSGILEAIDSAIQTQPVWMGLFLTEGAAIPTRVRMTSTPAPFATSTSLAPTTTKYSTGTPTNTLIYLPPSRTATSNPGFTKTPPATGTVTGTPISQTTSTSTVTATGTLTVTGTATGTPTATGTATGTATATATPTATFTTIPPEADLQIAIDDNATDYDAGASVRYTITASNPSGPSGVIGAIITGSFSTNLDLANITWACTSGASGNGDINTTVNIPVGSSITCTANATAVSSPTGPLSSSVTITSPTGITELVPGNNSATDTDTLITADTPPNTIGTDPDGKPYKLRSGNALTLNINLIANGDSAWDVVYYEYPGGSGIVLDWVTIEISDGRNWYPIFNWGDNIADTNSNMDFNKLPLPSIPPYPPPEEPDQRDIPATSLYVSPNGYATGIAIDIDSIVPPGNYSYIRFYAPPGDVDNGMEIDSIQVLP